MKRILIYTIISFLVFSCGNNQPAAKEEHAEPHDEHHEEAGNVAALTDQQVKTAGIELGKIEEKNLHASIRASGTLSVPNQNKALITSVNSGVLQTLLIHPGSFVKKGQAVATILNPDVTRVQQDLQTTNAQISLTEIELKRQKELVQGNAAPLKNVQRLETEMATLQATKNALQKQLTVMGISHASVSKGNIITTITITAPISGTVSHVHAQIGSPVNVSSPIAEIVNNSQLHLDLFVYEKDLPKLKDEQVIHFTLTNNPGKEYDAKIFSIGTAFVSETKTIPIHAVVMGDKTGLIEGMNITALVSIGEKVVHAVPSDAIVSFKGQDFIFVETKEPIEEDHAKEEQHKKEAEHEKEDNHTKEGEHDQEHKDHPKPTRFFERVQVIKGATDVGYTEITLVKEIPLTSPVVVKGAFFVSAKLSNTGGHEH